MAGLSVVSSPPNQFANTFSSPSANSGAVPGVALATQSFSGQLQGSGQLNNATIAPANATIAPANATAPTTRSLGDLVGSSGPITGTIPSKAVIGPAPAYRGVASDGTVFTDPNAQAQYEAKLSASKPVTYGGNSYTNYGDYANAVLKDAQTAHDQAVKQINTAHQNGLISFDQQQQLIDQSRQNLSQQLQGTLNSQSGYFNSISPDAVQSQQGVMAANSENQFNQGVNQLNNNQANLGTAQADEATNFQNSLSAADKQLTGVTDTLANNKTAQAQNQQDILNAGQNAAIAYQNQLANYQTQAANASQPTVTQFEPTTLAANIGNAFVNAHATGITAEQATPAILASLQGQGIDTNSPQFQNILRFITGQLNDSNSYYGGLYNSKSPSQVTNPVGPP